MAEPLDSALGWVAAHTRRYVETDGAEGHIWPAPEGVDVGVESAPCAVLTTTGRRSGQARRNALIYGQDGGNYVLVASYGGAPQHPLWYENLLADPKVGLQVGAQKLTGVARTANAEERARLWPLMTGLWPDYDKYQAKTDREIPVVIVEPAG